MSVIHKKSNGGASTEIEKEVREVKAAGEQTAALTSRTSFSISCYPIEILLEMSIITIVGFEIPFRNRGAVYENNESRNSG